MSSFREYIFPVIWLYQNVLCPLDKFDIVYCERYTSRTRNWLRSIRGASASLRFPLRSFVPFGGMDRDVYYRSSPSKLSFFFSPYGSFAFSPKIPRTERYDQEDKSPPPPSSFPRHLTIRSSDNLPIFREIFAGGEYTTLVTLELSPKRFTLDPLDGRVLLIFLVVDAIEGFLRWFATR